jgi:DNA-binding LacI/PurR family transcriptional regulator
VKLLTKKDVARYLRVSVRTVERMVNRGELREPIRYSLRTLRWRLEDLQACSLLVEDVGTESISKARSEVVAAEAA